MIALLGDEIVFRILELFEFDQLFDKPIVLTHPDCSPKVDPRRPKANFLIENVESPVSFFTWQG